MVPFRTVGSFCDHLLREYGADTKLEYKATGFDSWIVCPTFQWSVDKDNACLTFTTTILNRPNQEWDMHSADYRNIF